MSKGALHFVQSFQFWLLVSFVHLVNALPQVTMVHGLPYMSPQLFEKFTLLLLVIVLNTFKAIFEPFTNMLFLKNI